MPADPPPSARPPNAFARPRAAVRRASRDIEHWFSAERVGDRWQTLYDGGHPGVEEDHFRRRRDYAVRLVERHVPPDGRILDLGCGAGPVLSELALRDRPVVGLDCSADMLALARDRLRRNGAREARLLQADATRLPFADASFDCVVALGVISYQADYTPILHELRRVLAPRGLALVTFRNVWGPLVADPLKAARAVGRYLRGRPLGAVGLGRFLDPDDVQRRLEEADLVCERFVGIGVGPFGLGGIPLFRERTSVWISRRLTDALGRAGLEWTLRRMADVAIFVCRTR